MPSLRRWRRRIAPDGSRRHRLIRKAVLFVLHGRTANRLAAAVAEPQVTLVLPLSGATPEDVLASARSVLDQSDLRWELILTGQPSTSQTTDIPPDLRIRWCESTADDLAAALNAAVDSGRAPFIGVINAGDQLVPSALRLVLKSAQRLEADVLYSDEETINAAGPSSRAFGKPDWSPEFLLAFPYTGRLCLLRREMVKQLGGWDKSTVAAEEYALVLGAARAGRRIRRVEGTLYRRKTSLERLFGSSAAVAARRAALLEHLKGSPGVVADVPGPAQLRVSYPIANRGLVSVIIAMRDRIHLLDQCIRSIERLTEYANFEIVIVDNDSSDAQTLRYLEQTRHTVVRAPGPFNFSKINNVGARAARGEYLLFLNNDTEVVTPGWLDAMVEWAQRPEIGCVGARLLFGDGRMQHVGVTLHDGSAFHPGYGERPSNRSWLESDAVRNYSAVTAACLMVRRRVFEEVGGFDENFPLAYNDVDLCVRILRKGYRNLYTPYAALYHYESSSRTPGVAIVENEHLREAVGALLWNDPYCPANQRAGTAATVASTATPRWLGRASRVWARGTDILTAVRWHRASLKNAEEFATEADAQDAVRWIDRVDINGQSRIALFMHPAARRTYRVTIPPGGRLLVWLALMPETWNKNSGGVRFDVTADVGGRVRASRSKIVDPGLRSRHRRWIRMSVRLSALSGQTVNLTLATSLPPGAGPAHAWSVWGDPLLLEKKKTTAILKRQSQLVQSVGLRGAIRWYARLIRGGRLDQTVYESWFQQHASKKLDAMVIQSQLAELRDRPRISVVTPVYNTDPRWLRRCVESVRQQIYPDWQHCLADDGSTRPETVNALRELEQLDSRVKVVRLPGNGGISAASNGALSVATGDFVALLDHDDELAPDALLEVVRLLNEHPDADLIYTDEDKLEFDGTHSEPYFKPDWSPDLLRSTMYIGHLSVYRRALLERVGGFRSAFDGSQDYDLALRATECTNRIFHIPKVLYHWRKVPGSAAGELEAKPWAIDAAKRALMDHVARLPTPARVEADPGKGLWRVRYDIVGEPLVSVVIPTTGPIAASATGPRNLLLECLQSIVERTTYRRYELVIVDNGHLSPEVLEPLAAVPHRRLVYHRPGPFNFAATMNFAARHTEGDHLLFLNDDTEVIAGEWMTAMLEFSQQREVGAVGGKLFYPDGRIQHVGVVLGIGGGACHVLAGQAGDCPGYFGSALVIRNYSAVTGACFMTRRAVFEEVEGFDERFATDFNDVDYCLRAGARGYRVVGTPFARLYHFEGATFGSREHIVSPAEIEALSERWGAVIEADPFYNPNLTRSGLDYSLRL
jgi:GT2 family glycosyltransferase